MSVKPRIRIFLLLLAVTLALPATASANPWASINSLPLCVSDTLPAATTATDDTTVPSGWRNAAVNVNLQGTGEQGFEWKIDCGTTQTGATANISGTGTHSFLHRAQETGTGNWTGWVEDFVYVDTTLPVDTSTVPSGWQHDKATITLSGTDIGDQSGVSHMVYNLDGNGPTAANVGDTFDITGNGTHTLQTSVVDLAGNVSAVTPYVVHVDSAAPVDTTTVPAGWVTTPSVDVSVSGTDTGGSGVTQIEWELVEDARSATVPGAGPVNVTVNGEGVHTLRTRITDGDGKQSAWKIQTVRIDTVLPSDNTTVSSAWLNRSSLDVTVHGTDASSGVARVEYRIDGALPVLVNGNTTTATVSGGGEHILETRVVDVAGNTTGWVPRTVRLDPDSPVNSTPTAPTAWRQNAYGVRLNGSDTLSGVAHVEWQVDSGVVTTGSLGVTDAYVSGDGVHTLSTRIKDVAGNFSGWRNETISIDSVKPVDTTTVPATVAPSRKISITATDALSGPSGSVEWTLDNGPVKTSSQATINGAGPHVLKTRVQDNAGNWSDWKTFNTTVNSSLPSEDTDAPIDNTTIPTGWQTGPVTVTVTANDEGSDVRLVEYQVAGQAIVSGPNNATFTVSEDGVYTIKTRARDWAGNIGVWRTHTLQIDQKLPEDTADLPSGWVKSRDVALTATDATSGVATIEYTINGGSVVVVNADSANFTLPADGTFTIARSITDNAGQQTGWKTSTIKVDTAVPVNTSAAAPTAWQKTALSLDLTGSDVGSGVDRYEYRVGTGEIKSGTPAVVSTDGTQTLQTRVVDKAGNESAWRNETVKVDLTKPLNTTPVVSQPWRSTNFATTVSGTDAASGLATVEWKVDSGAVSTSPAVTIGAEGNYTLYTRVTDVAGNDSGWRLDMVGIDKTAPTLAANCGAPTWRNTAAVCTVAADGGLSGLPVLTASRGGDGAVAVTGGAYTVDVEGSTKVEFHASDGAGNSVTAQGAVKIDRTPPAVTATCIPDTKSLKYTCTAAGSDGLSGLTGLAWSVDGGAATPIAAGAPFTVAKGKVVVSGADAAGNTGVSAPVVLAERHEEAAAVTPRSSSEAVLLKGKAKSSKRLVGQLALSSTPTATTVDLRPLALGKGTFQLVIKVKLGKKTKTFTKTQTTVKGYSRRVTVKAGAGADPQVTLTVKRKSGKRWVTHATASAHL